MSVNIVSELDALGYEYQRIDDEQIKCICPFHDDNKPSLQINTKKQVFFCPVCKESGDIYSLLGKLNGLGRDETVNQLKSKYSYPTINIQTIEEFHHELLNRPDLLEPLRVRGISLDLIKYYRLGAQRDRITIPIKNEDGYVVNVRKYKPGGGDTAKMLSLKKRGQNRLYPLEQLDFETIVICGGEIKAIAAAFYLNAYKIGCISTTSGEGSWEPEFSEKLQAKTVYILMDIDDAGIKAAERLAKFISAGTLSRDGKVFICSLPLDKKKFPTGDVNDFIYTSSNPTFAMRKLITDAVQYKSVSAVDKAAEGTVTTCTFTEAYSAASTRRRVEFNGVVAGSSGEAFFLPKTIKVICSRNQKICDDCPVYYLPKTAHHTVPPESIELLELAGNTRKQQRKPLMDAVGVPSACKSFTAEVVDEYSVTATYLTPPLLDSGTGISDLDTDPKQGFVIGDRLETSEEYEFTGRLHPAPKTQIGTFMLSSAKLVGQSMFAFGGDDRLAVFQPADDSVAALNHKVDNIYNDLEVNVTQIYNRRPLHYAIDFCFFSCLNFNMAGRQCKGWVEVVIVGDSEQGKSQVAKDLSALYGLGEHIDASNTSSAGLIGSVQKIGERWCILWGALVRADQRLVIMEEISDAEPELVKRLTEARSSGIATISKAKSGKAHCRTRLAMISNPREVHIDNYSYGCLAIKDLVGGLEDVRRFDLGVVVNKRYQDTVCHVTAPEAYEQELHRNLVLWAWSRTTDQIQISNERYIKERAVSLCQQFVSDLPLIGLGWVHEKIARLSIALAARTYSTPDGEKLVVEKRHIDFIADFLETYYRTDEVGYRDYSLAVLQREKLHNVKMLTELIQTQETAEQLLYTEFITLPELCNVFLTDMMQARHMMSNLYQCNAIKRRELSFSTGREEYVKTSEFLKYLKNFKIEKAPNHVREDL